MFRVLKCVSIPTKSGQLLLLIQSIGIHHQKSTHYLKTEALIFQIIWIDACHGKDFHRTFITEIVGSFTACIRCRTSLKNDFCKQFPIKIEASKQEKNTLEKRKIELTWQWHAFASKYSYLRVSGSAWGWQNRSMATAFDRPACTHTGWYDFLYGNFQSDISRESQRPQHDQTLTWSQHSWPISIV